MSIYFGYLPKFSSREPMRLIFDIQSEMTQLLNYHKILTKSKTTHYAGLVQNNTYYIVDLQLIIIRISLWIESCSLNLQSNTLMQLLFSPCVLNALF